MLFLVKANLLSAFLSTYVHQVGPSLECSKSLMKMTYCPHCHGLPDLKPCSSYCLIVMMRCLAHHRELDKEWNNYIDSLMLLASRLEASFNIESVVNPIDIKISEAIMNFQENGIAVTQKVIASLKLLKQLRQLYLIAL